ncbi:MAG: Hpt domain-containing protein [Alphaproteobacteria bacterium]
MSTETVDLSNLRMATDGDAELEQELFEEFISSTTDLIHDLENHCQGSSDNEKWRTSSHALKGIALNLGANPLGALGKNAQDISEHSIDEKTRLLSNIKSEHQKVLEFLKTQ